MPKDELAKKSYEVAALKRGLLILDHFVGNPDRDLTISEVARAVGIHRATALRFLNTLESCGYLVSTERAGSYRFASKLQQRTAAALPLVALELTSVPILKDLAEETGETADLGILYRGKVVFVQVVEGPQSVRVQQRVGVERSAHVTALGKMLLAGLNEQELEDWLKDRTLEVMTPNSIASPQRLRAELSEIRRCGCAVDEQEFELGLACIAAPVKDNSGKTTAAVGIAGPSSRVTYHRIPELIGAVQQAAKRLSKIVRSLSTNVELAPN